MRPARGRDQAGDHAQEGGLARAVGADHRHRLALGHAQAHVPERGEIAVARGDLGELEHQLEHDLLAEVRLDHLGVLRDLERRALGDLLAVVQHHHAVHHAHAGCP